MIMPFGFSIERIIALRMAKSYENVRTVLGPLLIFVLVSYVLNLTFVITQICQIGIDLILLFTVFRDESFNDSFISFILIPATTAQTFNSYCWILLYAELGNLLCNCIILLVHSKFKTK